MYRQRGGTSPASGLLGTDWTRIPTGSKVVVLTFDAGANAAGLPSISSTLRSRKVPATYRTSSRQPTSQGGDSIRQASAGSAILA